MAIIRDLEGRIAELELAVEQRTKALLAARTDLQQMLATVEKMTATPTPDAIKHLLDMMVGTGACLMIEDGADKVEMVFGQDSNDSVSAWPDDVVEVIDALTTLQNHREEAAS